VTPDIVTVFSETVLDLSPSFIRFGLVAALWFVLLVTAVDQARRQLAALDICTYDNFQLRVWSRVSPSSLRTVGDLFALVSGTMVATITFPYAVEALKSLIPLISPPNPVEFEVMELFVMLVFFIAYSFAAHSLDRLVIGGVRTLTSD
jgi:hypothetical protein